MSYKSILIGLKSNKGIIKGWVQDLLDEIPKEVLKGYVLDVIRDYDATKEYGCTDDIRKSSFKIIFNDKLFLYIDEGIYHLNDIEISQFITIETFDGKTNKLLFELNTIHYGSVRIKLDKWYVFNTLFNNIEKYLRQEKYMFKGYKKIESNIPKEPIVFVLSNGDYIIEQNIDDWLSYIRNFIENEEKNMCSYVGVEMQKFHIKEVFVDDCIYREARKIKEIYLANETYYNFQRFFYGNPYYHKYTKHNHDGTITLNYPYPINIRLNQKYCLTD